MSKVASELGVLPSELPAVARKATMPGGFRAGGTAAGIKASGRTDLAIIATLPDATGRAVPASAAAVFTPNAFVAAPVRLSQKHLRETSATGRGGYGLAEAVISTSGCANAATGAAGDRDQAEVATLLAGSLGIAPERTLLLSTGVIGTRLPLDRVGAGISYLVPRLEATDEALAAAAEALRTTDTRTKTASVTITLPDPDGLAVRPVRVTGIAKGVGMIHPRMATMLAVVLTDATVEPALLHSILRPAAARTWNQLSVDGDTSTNDTVFLLASGAADAAPVREGSPESRELGLAIEAVARELARQQAADGEGATTLVTCQVSGAIDDADARAVARAVISSSLVKAAVHGRDPNWGRIAGAAGNARLADAAVLEAAGMTPETAAQRGGTPAVVDPDKLRIAIAGHLVFSGGSGGGPVAFDRAAARSAMDSPELLIRLDLGLGNGTGEAFGCDLTEEYVIENSEYTT
ncbi:MAG TPA: bifunctional ornithine acetyltransferase/N-acetylglutamate synthase [Candidatus Limnocylindrales bacterium]|nr:bifunctional ornithine acetyltransferase/N-acetylglutamate synthase [Candidatus Limnocylindrales bacterium]